MSQLIVFLDPRLVVIVLICYLFGMMLKSSKVKDNLIPILVMVFAIMLTMAYMAFVLGDPIGKVAVLGVIQGIICASLSVFGNQVWKQLINKNK